MIDVDTAPPKILENARSQQNRVNPNIFNSSLSIDVDIAPQKFQKMPAQNKTCLALTYSIQAYLMGLQDESYYAWSYCRQYDVARKRYKLW